MPRRTRSIVLVLLGTAAAGCDRRRSPPLPAEPDDAGHPTTQPVYGDGSTPPYGYGPMAHGRRTGLGWMGGSVFDSGRRYGWEYGYPWGRPYVPRYRSYPARTYTGGTSSFSASPSHFSSGDGPSVSHSSAFGRGTTFGGFGAHASFSHAGS